jgi:serine phosphatase RsbU (regulator of sigma subunit)/anti-sigma regulatory factor (Ser/Thr protein kinase)/DNA-binding response OmpR family regulator
MSLRRILLLLSHQGNRRLLGEWLSRNYQIVLGDNPERLWEPFDLAILDGPALSYLHTRVKARKEAEEPVFLPFLLLTHRHDTGMITRDLWQTVDELILTPIDRFELQARVEVLLRVRQESLDLKRRNDELAALVSELTTSFEVATDEGQLAQILLNRTLEATNSQAGAVVFFDNGQLQPVINIGKGLEELLNSHLTAHSALQGALREGSTVVLLPDSLRVGAPRQNQGTLTTENQPTLVMPLLIKNEPAGALVLQKGDAAPFDAGQTNLVHSLCAQAGVFLHNLRQAQRLVEAARLYQQVELAKTMQQQLLPATDLEIEGLDIAAAYLASNQVGGDYYDIFQLARHKVAAVVADVSGHSIASGLLMTAARSTVQLLVQHQSSPAEVLRQLNKTIYRDLEQTGLFLSIIIVTIDLESRVACYANAGHNPPFLYQGVSGKVVGLNATGMLVGILPDAAYEERQLDLNLGDTLVLYTDGIAEARSVRGEFFGEQRLNDLIVTGAPNRARHIADSIMINVCRHTQRDLTDDATLLVLKLVSGQGSGRMTPAQRTLTVLGQLAEVPNIRRWLREVLTDWSVSTSIIADLALAATEVCTNTIRHGYNGGKGGEIEVHLSREEEAIYLTIVDTAPTFTPWAGVAPPPEALVEGGYGLYLVQNLVDEVSYQSNGDRGNRIVLVKRTKPNR